MKRPIALGLLIAPLVPVLIWFLAALYGYVAIRSFGLGVLVAAILGVPVSYAVGVPLLLVLVLLLRRVKLLNSWNVIAAATVVSGFGTYVWWTSNLAWFGSTPLISKAEISQEALVVGITLYGFLLSMVFCLLTGITWRFRNQP
jgi:hypothetical protein